MSILFPQFTSCFIGTWYHQGATKLRGGFWIFALITLIWLVVFKLFSLPHFFVGFWWNFVWMMQGRGTNYTIIGAQKHSRTYSADRLLVCILPGPDEPFNEHIKTVEQWTTHYTAVRWLVHWPWRIGCYNWYSEEGPGRAAAPPSPLLAIPNVTAHPSMASVSK